MNLPNKLTLSRFVFTAGFLFALFSELRWGPTIALVLFVVASITDYLDGYFARRDKLVTHFGVLMDPLADKILICSAFIAFVGLEVEGMQKIPAWMAIVVVSRELAITGLRLLAASQQVVLAAERWGKDKTVSQMVAVISVLVLMSHREWGGWAETLFSAWLPFFARFSLMLAVVLTFVSGVLYLWRNRGIYLKDL